MCVFRRALKIEEVWGCFLGLVMVRVEKMVCRAVAGGRWLGWRGVGERIEEDESP